MLQLKVKILPCTQMKRLIIMCAGAVDFGNMLNSFCQEEAFSHSLRQVGFYTIQAFATRHLPDQMVIAR